MTWIFDWKCSLYSLTVCLDSMSPLLLFNFFFFFFALLSHSATVVFPIPQDYWTKYKQNKPHQDTSAVREPRTEQNKNWGSNYKMPFLWLIHTVLGEASTSTIMEGGLEQYCTFFFPFFFRGPLFTVLLISLNVGATPDWHRKHHSCDGQRTALALQL